MGRESVLESTIDIGNEQNLTIGLSQKYRDIDRKRTYSNLRERMKTPNPHIQ